MDRREFLKKSMFLTAGAMVGSSFLAKAIPASAGSTATASKKAKEIGLQLYSLGGKMSDVSGSLKSISEMGYTAAETASYDNGKFYGLAPAEFRKIAEDFGIRVGIVDADNVEIALVELPVASFLRILPPPYLADVIALEWA